MSSRAEGLNLPTPASFQSGEIEWYRLRIYHPQVRVCPSVVYVGVPHSQLVHPSPAFVDVLARIRFQPLWSAIPMPPLKELVRLPRPKQPSFSRRRVSPRESFGWLQTFYGPTATKFRAPCFRRFTGGQQL